MKRYILGLLLVGAQINAVTVIDDSYRPKKTHETASMTTLWTSFDGGDGKISTDLGAATIIRDMAVDTNGDIYVCGSLVDSNAVMMIARYRKNNNGVYALDTSWDSGGNGYAKFVTDDASVANAIALHGDHVYVTGSGKISTVSKVIGKIKKSNAMPESAFGTNGFVRSGLGINAVGHGIIVDGDYVYAVGTDGDDATITKVHRVTGVLHAEFDGDSGTGGSNGELTIDVSGGSTDIAYAVALDGTTLWITGDADSDMFVIKMDTKTGKLHTAANGFTAFATNGIAYTSGDSNAVGRAIAFDKNDVFVAGDNASTSAVVQAWNRTTGSLVSGFGTSGRWEDSNVGALKALRILAGKLYVAGVKSSKMAIARLNKRGSSPLDPSFFTNGYDVALGDNASAGAFALDFLKEPHLPIILAGYDTSGDIIELTVYNNDVDVIRAAQLGELPAGHLAGGMACAPA